MTDFKDKNLEEQPINPAKEENISDCSTAEVGVQEYANQAEEENYPPLSYYDIIYGVLFDPLKTMGRIAQNPPVGATFLIVIALALVELLTGLYTSAYGGTRNLGLEMGLPFTQAMIFSEASGAAPVLAFLGTIFYFLKWFFYSALLHLLAEFYGGNGRAKTVFVMYGLAGLPGALLIPLEVLTTLAIPRMATVVNTIGGLIVLVWGIALLTIGIREAHKLSTGRALAVVFTPVVALIVVVVVTIVGALTALSSFIPSGW
ncbi:hypothetical protein N752_30615 [Desulforamulus aquiferis]|nr:Yip1 family protein [Desulforamulus aquiferis]RYD01349.1 hypothetical protein N752_30615 [Desulforamulus aquiferis]